MNTLVVTVSKKMGGYNFGLSPKVRREVAEMFPGSFQLPLIHIAYDVKSDFEEVYGKIQNHILPFLTGVETEQLSQKIQRVRFIDPSTGHPIYTLSLSHVEEALARRTLSGRKAMEKAAFRALLLKGPVMSEEQYQQFLQTRNWMSQWRASH
ncbi:MAG: hypothetical protein ACKVUS_09510 [Saprospiraceae bacterium]